MMVTLVPPDSGPLLGDRPVMVGVYRAAPAVGGGATGEGRERLREERLRETS